VGVVGKQVTKQFTKGSKCTGVEQEERGAGRAAKERDELSATRYLTEAEVGGMQKGGGAAVLFGST
jgi:hypothetical protein